MPTWSTRYVLLRNRDADIERVKKETGALDVLADSGSKYASIPVANPSLQPDDLASLSKSFGEAFSIQVHSVADLVIYDHFRDGERARGLTFAGEAGWVRVTGAPEAWEKDHFFAQAKLDQLLEELEDEITDLAALARDSAELKKLFAGGKLVEGSLRPAPQWKGVAQAVARQYGLPEAGPASSARMPAKK
jgi:hypothetical protein